LLLVAGALVVAERRLVPAVVPSAESSVPRIPVSSLLLAVFPAASAVQVAAFINAAPRYLRDVDPLWLPWLLPVFWIGLGLTGWPQQAEWAPYLVVAPPLAAALAAVPILTAMRLRRLRGSSDPR
jgi:hypothetical protein